MYVHLGQWTSRDFKEKTDLVRKCNSEINNRTVIISNKFTNDNTNTLLRYIRDS